MTELFIKSEDCNCSTKEDKNLALAEGHSTIWICHHVKALEKRTSVVWK